MAFVVVGVMVLTGFAIVGQMAPKAPAASEPAKTMAVGAKEMTYTIDHMFELYMKSHDPAMLGHWNMTMGLNEWWPLREDQYQEFQCRQTYPFILNYNPYSTATTPDVDQGGSITTWYRLTIDAKNCTASALGPNKDPIFTPVFGNIAGGTGAWMNITWYGTYLETWELTALRAGTHYGNTYYGVSPGRATPDPGGDDGYYHELQGKVEFNRPAAVKVLGFTGSNSLIDQFNANKSTLSSKWMNDWLAESGSKGIYDTYTAYDYSNAIQYFILTLDPASTANNLIIRMYTISWGNECLLIRYLEAAQVMTYWQAWMDDWYLNITVGPEAADVHSRGVAGYHMYATKDYNNNINGWALEASHMDWCGNAQGHTTYISKYTAYDPDTTNVLHTSTAPLTKNFGQPVSYILAPLHWNLTANEKIVIKLPDASTMVPGYWPQSSTLDDIVENLPQSAIDKKAEMAGNCTWGTLVAGNGWPATGALATKSFYSSATRTFTVQGPKSFPVNWNPTYPGILNYGAPMFVMNVVKTQTLNLVAGWNLVSAQYADYGYKASTLGLSSGDQVVKFDPATQTYKTYVVGMPLNDFTIDPSDGYWIYAASPKVLTLYGDLDHTPPVTRAVTLPGAGWMIVTLNTEKTTFNAQQLAAMYSGGVSQVVKWNAALGTYTTYVVGMPLNNFAIVPGQAYWLFAGGSGTLTYTP